MKDSLRVGIFLDFETKEHEVVSSLLADGRINPICFYTANDFLDQCLESRLDGAIVGIHAHANQDFTEVRKLADVLSPFPLLFLVDKYLENWSAELSFCENAYLLPSDRQLFDLAGKMVRVIHDAKSPQRDSQRRKVTMEQAGFLSTSNRGTCLITDISDGGVGAIVHQEDLSAGDHVQLFFPISDAFEMHHVQARVCWESPFTDDAGTLKRVGIEFANAKAGLAAA